MIYSLNNSKRIIAGAGAINELPNQLKLLKAKNILIVTDAYIESSGILDNVIIALDQAGINFKIFSKVQPDPTVNNVMEGLDLFNNMQADVLVAIGGGSPMDAAKAIAILKNNPQPLSQYMGYHKIPEPGAPLIAIPTTAGTGSEVTRVTVITDEENDVKMMILDDNLQPLVAIVDFELTLSMPAPLTAHVGVDTLTHGMEAYVSKKANGLTDPIALSCIGLVAEHLEKAWKDPNNRTAREGMSLAACQGGMAFSNSSVCLVHGMSRPLGVQFHIPHGLSNAVLLPAVTRFSIPGAVSRYGAISRKMGLASNEDSDESAAMTLVDELESMNKRMKIPNIQKIKGVDETRFNTSVEKMAIDALASGSPQNNPVVPTVEQIIELYRQAYGIS